MALVTSHKKNDMRVYTTVEIAYNTYIDTQSKKLREVCDKSVIVSYLFNCDGRVMTIAIWILDFRVAWIYGSSDK